MKLYTLEQVIDALGRGQGLDGINITLPRVCCTQFDVSNPFDFALEEREERDEIVLHGYYTFKDVKGILDYQCEGYGDVAKNVRKELHFLIMQLFFIMKCRPYVLRSVVNETFCYLIDCFFVIKMYEDNGCHEVAELIEGFANDIFLLFCPHISVDGDVMLQWERDGFRLECGFFGGMFECYKREGESDGLYMTYYPYYHELLYERQPRIVEIRRGVMRYIMEQMLPKLTDEVFLNHYAQQTKEMEEMMFAEGYVEERNDKGEEEQVADERDSRADGLILKCLRFLNGECDGSRFISEEDYGRLEGYVRELIVTGKCPQKVEQIERLERKIKTGVRKWGKEWVSRPIADIHDEVFARRNIDGEWAEFVGKLCYGGGESGLETGKKRFRDKPKNYEKIKKNVKF